MEPMPQESDEQYARRLQAQELGLGSRQYQPVQLTAEGTPLILNGNANRENPTIIDARLSELSSARITLCAILTVFGPQILAAVIVLAENWNEAGICDVEHVTKWKYWAALSALRMFAYASVVIIMHVCKQWLEEHPQQYQNINSVRNIVDALGLIWFVVGNMWVFAEDDTFGCRHPERSPIYGLCVAMLIINYIQICLPCIAAIIVIPIFCLCMPCLIQVIARLHNPRASRGAADGVIDTIPVVVIGPEHSGEEPCPICLKEMTTGEEARLLPCKHLFHKECVDTWLHVNATCPTCRTDINPRTDADEIGANGGALSGGGMSSHSSNSSGSLGGGAGGGVSSAGSSPGSSIQALPNSALAITRQRQSFHIDGGGSGTRL